MSFANSFARAFIPVALVAALPPRLRRRRREN